MQFKAVAPNVFVWLDTCNVYVIKDGASAILIDIGDGLVLDALLQIGVPQSSGCSTRTTIASSARGIQNLLVTRWPAVA